MRERPPRLWRLVREEARRLPLSRMAAALAYFTVFSLPGTVAVAVWVLGTVAGEGAAREHLLLEVSRAMGSEAAASLRTLVEHASAPGGVGPVRATIAVLGIVLGATGAFLELQSALNAVWRVRARKARSDVVELVAKRLLSFAMVCGVAGLLLVSVAVAAGLSLVGEQLSQRGLESFSVPALHLLEMGLSAGLLTVAFAAIYRYLPDCRVAWREVWFGAALAAGALTLAKYPLGVYLAHGGASGAYGASGSLVVLVFTVYVGCLVFLLGAVVTRARARGVAARA